MAETCQSQEYFGWQSQLKRAEEMESAVAFRGGIFECANKSRVAAGKAEKRWKCQRTGKCTKAHLELFSSILIAVVVAVKTEQTNKHGSRGANAVTVVPTAVFRLRIFPGQAGSGLRACQCAPVCMWGSNALLLTILKKCHAPLAHPPHIGNYIYIVIPFLFLPHWVQGYNKCCLMRNIKSFSLRRYLYMWHTYIFSFNISKLILQDTYKKTLK